jgi:uncharacterized protein (TIGR00255 family)
MIKSMTGHGCVEKLSEYGNISVEMRSVNSRYLDISIKAPEYLEVYKNDFSKILSEKLNRGRITVFIKIEQENNEILSVNVDVAKKLYGELQALNKELGIKETVTLRHLLEVPEIVREKEPKIEMGKLVADIKAILAQAADNMDSMRTVEGKNLAEGFKKQLQVIQSSLDSVKEKISHRKESYFKKYKDLIKELAGDIEIDNDRLTQEVAMMAKKVDISEECDRIESHISQFMDYLKKEDPVGKKMNFLVQELNREMTTIGAKSESADISQLVVTMKNELEKIREQVQNIL